MEEKNLHVGIFTNSYRPTLSGVVNAVDLIYKGLLRLGHQPYIFAPGFPGYHETDQRIFRFPSVNLLPKTKFPLAIPWHPGFNAEIERLKLDIVHSHYPFLLGKLGAGVAHKLNIPLVYTFHTQFEEYAHYVPLVPPALVRRFIRNSVFHYAQGCDALICPAPSIKELIHSYKITTPLIDLPNTIEVDRFSRQSSPELKASLGIASDDKVLIFVGRMALEKNLTMLLQAFKLICADEPKIRLILVGEGTYLPNLKAEASALNLGDKVIFPGRVEYDEVARYYWISDVFVMTSCTEVKPLALLEAMAAGLPVVAVDACGAADTITTGVDGLLTANNPQAFAQEVVKLITQEKLYRTMSAAAVEHAQKYSLERTTQKLVQHYRELIRNKS